MRILDQRVLPAREVYRELRTVDDVCDAIRTLAVRGAPAIGIAGAMGLVAARSTTNRDDRGRVPGAQVARRAERAFARRVRPR